MKNRTGIFSIALRIHGVVSILLLDSVAALSQNTATTAPDGTKARNVLNLQMHHATISVADIQAETNWYILTLGFSFPSGSQGVQKINPKMKGGRLIIPGFQLDLIQYEGSQRAKASSPVSSSRDTFTSPSPFRTSMQPTAFYRPREQMSLGTAIERASWEHSSCMIRKAMNWRSPPVRRVSDLIPARCT